MPTTKNQKAALNSGPRVNCNAFIQVKPLVGVAGLPPAVVPSSVPVAAAPVVGVIVSVAEIVAVDVLATPVDCAHSVAMTQQGSSVVVGLIVGVAGASGVIIAR